MESIVARITELARAHNLTGVELGKKLDLKKSPLTDWKNGQSKPTVDQIKDLCELFAVSADFILFGERSKFNDNSLELTLKEKDLLYKFRKLPDNAQLDIIDNLEIKYNRAFTSQTLLPSKNGKKKTKNSTGTA